MKKVLFLAVMVGLAGCEKSENANQPNIAKDEIRPSIESREGEWRVVVNRDEMRNTESRRLALRSGNNADLDFPYDGENRLQLDVLDSKRGSARIFLTIDRGQYDCGSYGCSVSVKVGNNPVQDV